MKRANKHSAGNGRITSYLLLDYPRPAVPDRERQAVRPHHTMNRPSQTALALIGVLLTLLTACSKRDKAVGIGDDDPKMAAAISKAQATLPQFWQMFDKREHGESNFVLDRKS